MAPKLLVYKFSQSEELLVFRGIAPIMYVCSQTQLKNFYKNLKFFSAWLFKIVLN